MAGKARNPTTLPESLRRQNQTDQILYGLFRQKLTGASSGGIAIGGGTGSGGAGTPTGKYVKIAGDLMEGPLGFNPKAVQLDTNGIVDVSLDTGLAHSSRVVVLGEGAADDDINFIRSKNVRPGQLLFLQGVLGINLTLKYNVTPTDTSLRPIRTQSGADLVNVGNNILLLQYDESANQFAVISGAGSGSGSNLLSDLIIDVAKDWAAMDITNLGTITPGTDKDIGSTSSPWTDVFTKTVRFQPGIITSNKPMITADASDNMELNVPNGGAYQFHFGASFDWSLTSTNLGGANITLNEAFILNDSVTNPSFNGEFRRNGNDVFVYSGGALRNLSTLGAAGGANVFLSNLTSPTSVNQALLPSGSATLDLGSELLPWRIVHAREVEFITTSSTPSGVTDTQIGKNATGNMHFNVDTASAGYLWYFEGVNKWGMTPSTLTGDNIILTTSLTVNDAVSFAGFNGAIYREGNDVKIYSGGVERNISSIGTGSSFENPAIADLDMDGFDIITDADGNSKLRFGINNVISVQLDGITRWVFGAGVHNAGGLRIENGAAPLADLDLATKKYVDDTSAGANSLDDLSDVLISGLTTDHILHYTGTQWVNTSPSAAGLALTTLNNLGSVAINSHLTPAADNLIDLGSSSRQFKDGWFDGTVNADRLEMGGDIDMNGNDIESGSSIIIRVGGGETARFTSSEFRMASGHIIDYGNNISLSASGGFVTLPSQPLGFINVQVNGGNARIPYYGT